MAQITIQLLLSFWLMAGFSSCNKSTLPENEDTGDVPAAPVTLNDIRQGMVDKEATNETAALFHNMRTLAKTQILFGHQDATKREIGRAHV